MALATNTLKKTTQIVMCVAVYRHESPSAHLRLSAHSNGYTYVQKKELRKKLTEEKLEKLCKKRKENGGWIPDDDFPSDEEEDWLLMHDNRAFTTDNNTEEAIGAKQKQQLEGEAADAILGEGGLLSAAHMQVALQSSNDQQQLGMLDQVNKNLGIVSKAADKPDPKKKTPKDKVPKPDSVQPAIKTLSDLDKARAKIKDILEKGKEARSLYTQLDGVGLSSEIAGHLAKYADMVDESYKNMRDMCTGVTDESFSLNLEAYKDQVKDHFYNIICVSRPPPSQSHLIPLALGTDPWIRDALDMGGGHSSHGPGCTYILHAQCIYVGINMWYIPGSYKWEAVYRIGKSMWAFADG